MRALRLLVVAAAAALAVGRAEAADQVDLQLVLAVDISRSMDANEQNVQRSGYVAAFRDPDVMAAITSGAYGKIAVTYVEWAGAFYQRTVVPWQVIGSDTDSQAFAAKLAAAPLHSESRTSISGGLLFAASAFTRSGVQSDRRSIDVSGDGSNNDGRPLTPVHDQLVSQGITINGLPILIDPSPIYTPNPVSLADYYHDCVIGGPDAFVIPITKLDQFADAIRRKLILEIAAARPQALPAAQTSPAPAAVDCTRAEQFTGGFLAVAGIGASSSAASGGDSYQRVRGRRRFQRSPGRSALAACCRRRVRREVVAVSSVSSPATPAGSGAWAMTTLGSGAHARPRRHHDLGRLLLARRQGRWLARGNGNGSGCLGSHDPRFTALPRRDRRLARGQIGKDARRRQRLPNLPRGLRRRSAPRSVRRRTSATMGSCASCNCNSEKSGWAADATRLLFRDWTINGLGV